MYIQGITIKSSGTVVSSLANELYRARNPYIGDARQTEGSQAHWDIKGTGKF